MRKSPGARGQWWRRDAGSAAHGQWAIILGVALGALVLAGCSASPSASQSSRTTASTQRTSVPATTTTADPTATAVLHAYRAAWAAFEHAIATADAADPELAATMTGKQLQAVRANLLGDHRAGVIGRGTFVLHPTLTARSATTATVTDCANSTSVLVYQASGKPVPPITKPEHDGVTATLVRTGGTWKVAAQKVTDGTCEPGS